MTRDRRAIEPDSALEIHEFTIKARDSYDIRVRSYKEKSLSSRFQDLRKLK